MIINDNGLIQYAPEDNQNEVILCDECDNEIYGSDIENAKDYYNGKFTGCYYCKECKKSKL